MPARALCLAVSAALLWPVASAAAVPRTFFGVVPQGPLTSRDFDRMRGVVGTVRIPVNWFQIESRAAHDDFAALDETIGQAADRGIWVLPCVYGSPSWLTGDPALPPQGTARGRAAWAAFLRRLVHRYGPHGAFWRGRAHRAPIRRWQIWNEPNFLLFWRPRPSPAGYARLLKIAARAIRGADPGARIVLAGVAPVEPGPLPWVYLRQLYEIGGVERSFDVVALHPYAPSPASLEYQIAQVRATMAAAGDWRTPLEVTEFGVASGGSADSPMIKDPRGQATFLRRAFRLLLENRASWRLSGVAWFSWDDGLSDPHCVFCQYAGLFDAGDTPKPAWWALRRMVGKVADER